MLLCPSEVETERGQPGGCSWPCLGPTLGLPQCGLFHKNHPLADVLDSTLAAWDPSFTGPSFPSRKMQHPDPLPGPETRNILAPPGSWAWLSGTPAPHPTFYCTSSCHLSPPSPPPWSPTIFFLWVDYTLLALPSATLNLLVSARMRFLPAEVTLHMSPFRGFPWPSSFMKASHPCHITWLSLWHPHPPPAELLSCSQDHRLVSPLESKLLPALLCWGSQNSRAAPRGDRSSTKDLKKNFYWSIMALLCQRRSV